MLRAARLLSLAGALIGAPVLLSGPVAAQDPSAPTPPGSVAVGPGADAATAIPFRILDQDRLLRESRLGQQVLAEIRAGEQALEAENQRLFDQLAAEERALTDLRATLGPEEFRARADAFDARVEEIRAERSRAAQALGAQSEAAAQRFFDLALPVLVQLMADQGIAGLLNRDALILASDALDITDAAIARLDAATRTGSATDD